MKCQECGEAEAVVHLTQIENNEVRASHLCERCAAARGLEVGDAPPPGLPLQEFLAQMGASDPASSTRPSGEPCAFCGLTFEGFRESGRLGCPHCWTSFEDELGTLVRRVHGATQHVGKVYLPPDPGAGDRERRMEGLRHRLQRAVEAEDFERAAALRDEIRALGAVEADRAG